jgi:hypothetical protein
VRDQKRENNNNWRGGMSFNKITGYYTSSAPWHPFAWENGRVLTHRLIMEKHLSELAGEEVIIPSEYDVHHKNEIKTDNRIENLEILTHGGHTTGHNEIDTSNRRCYNCGTNKTSSNKKRDGSPKPDWRTHPTIKGEYLCKKCSQLKEFRGTIICKICNETRTKFAKGICERCFDRKKRDESPLIKCTGCGEMIHELDTNGVKRTQCRKCLRKRY